MPPVLFKYDTSVDFTASHPVSLLRLGILPCHLAIMVSAINAPFGVGAPAYPGRSNDHIVTTHCELPYIILATFLLTPPVPTWDHILGFVNADPAIWGGFTNMYAGHPVTMPANSHLKQVPACHAAETRSPTLR